MICGRGKWQNLQEFLRTGFDTPQSILFLPSFPASWTPSCAKRRQSSPPLSPLSWWHMTYILSRNKNHWTKLQTKRMFWLLHASVHPSQQELQLHHEASRVLIILKMNIFLVNLPTKWLRISWPFYKSYFLVGDSNFVAVRLSLNDSSLKVLVNDLMIGMFL